MTAALLVLLLAPGDALPAPLDALRDANRAVRARAVQELAAHGPPSADLVAYAAHADLRVAAGVLEALRARGAEDVLLPLAALAGGGDAERAQLAADACVAIALARRVPLEELEGGDADLLHRRLAYAAATAVEGHLAAVRGDASLETPQLYRALYAAGSHGTAPLERIARDPARPARLRAHALHAHARLAGPTPLLDALLDDADPEVRSHAAALSLRYGENLEKLAGRLDGGRTLAPGERACAVAAAGRVGRIGEGGARVLERAVLREGALYDALAAAAALHGIDAARAAPAVRASVGRLLDIDAEHPGGGAGAALFALRCGPLEPGLVERMRAAPCPLLPAAVEDDPAKALALVRPLLGSHAGSREGIRVQAVAALLDRHDAPSPDRIVFAASTFREDAAGFAAYGLAQLRSVPPEEWVALRPRVEAALADPTEGTRLAAAELLLPDPRAFRACVDALWDGDPLRGAWAARLLGSEAAPLQDGSTAAARRRIAYALGVAGTPADEG